MQLILVRHARTALNAANVYQGQGVNAPLDAIGLHQAMLLARRLKSLPIDAIYTSDLDRAQQTAKAVLCAKTPSPALRITESLRERNLGDYEGVPIDSEVYRKDFEASGLSFADFCPPNGESWGQLHTRAKGAFHQIIAGHGKEPLVLISHGGFLTMLLLYLLNEEVSRENQKVFRLDNTSVSIIHWDNQHQALERVETINDTTHLA